MHVLVCRPTDVLAKFFHAQDAFDLSSVVVAFGFR